MPNDPLPAWMRDFTTSIGLLSTCVSSARPDSVSRDDAGPWSGAHRGEATSDAAAQEGDPRGCALLLVTHPRTDLALGAIEEAEAHRDRRGLSGSGGPGADVEVTQASLGDDRKHRRRRARLALTGSRLPQHLEPLCRRGPEQSLGHTRTEPAEPTP
eukprot:scaffold233885_cov28-Tisochrysis_lutea.AAC.2